MDRLARTNEMIAEEEARIAKRREHFKSLRADARKYAKLEAFLEVHKQQAAEFLKDKFEFVNALVDGVRDETGSISAELVARLDARDKKVIMDAFAAIEKAAGLQQKTTEHKHTHTLTLADKFKELQAGTDDGEVIEVEVIEEDG